MKSKRITSGMQPYDQISNVGYKECSTSSTNPSHKKISLCTYSLNNNPPRFLKTKAYNSLRIFFKNGLWVQNPITKQSLNTHSHLEKMIDLHWAIIRPQIFKNKLLLLYSRLCSSTQLQLQSLSSVPWRNTPPHLTYVPSSAYAFNSWHDAFPTREHF